MGFLPRGHLLAFMLDPITGIPSTTNHYAGLVLENLHTSYYLGKGRLQRNDYGPRWYYYLPKYRLAYERQGEAADYSCDRLADVSRNLFRKYNTLHQDQQLAIMQGRCSTYRMGRAFVIG